MAAPTVLVTGTSSGIGRAAVKTLRDRGCTVVATARRSADIEDLIEEGRVETRVLDVTRPEQVAAAVAGTLERHGAIDALVNNAGFGAMLPAEEMPEEVLEAMFEVNLFGVHRLTRAVLPSMRERGAGRVVNISSVAGHVTLPMMGGYSATKFALRAYTQAMHMELQPFGVHACLVEPGRIRTSFSDRSRRERDAAAPGDSPYAVLHAQWDRVVHDGGGHPQTIARRIAHACLARRPRFRYVAPWDGKAGVLAKRLLPDRALNRLVGAYFHRSKRS